MPKPKRGNNSAARSHYDQVQKYGAEVVNRKKKLSVEARRQKRIAAAKAAEQKAA